MKIFTVTYLNIIDGEEGTVCAFSSKEEAQSYACLLTDEKDEQDDYICFNVKELDLYNKIEDIEVEDEYYN